MKDDTKWRLDPVSIDGSRLADSAIATVEDLRDALAISKKMHRQTTLEAKRLAEVVMQGALVFAGIFDRDVIALAERVKAED